MINILDQSQCCGCTACASICTHDAINMIPDTLGFKYPQINKSKCIECGLCEKVCAFNAHYDISKNLNEPLIYAARHKNIQEVQTSRSGAAFIAISDYILENGGIVYGAGYKDHFIVTHKRAITKIERNEFKGSKYVQSDLENTFKQIKNDLKQGYKVLFSGTPCQTAGLNSFIGKQLNNNLFLVDIVCHGVPAPDIWQDYLNFIEKKYKSKIIKVDFRDKSRVGWSGNVESFLLENNKKIEAHTYTRLFYKHIMLRPSCGKCPFTNFNRPSDITIADYWGWEKLDMNINKDDKGISLMLINSHKGDQLFNLIKDRLTTIASKKELCIQHNLKSPSALSIQSKDFEKDYKDKGFHYVMKKYGTPSWKEKLYEYKKALGIRTRIKKILGV